MAEEQRVGEIIEACTTDFTAQCYELYKSPPLGSLVKTSLKSKAPKSVTPGCTVNYLQVPDSFRRTRTASYRPW
jgi:hypothetical protein